MRFGRTLAGLGLLAGISYFGKHRMQAEKSMVNSAGFLGYLKGMGQGFIYGARSILRFR
jgi:hypothetical protein